MKNFVKVFFAAAVLFAAAVTASAVPARPGTFKYTQPDGTVIELRRHGDEFFHWTTRSADGQVMKLGADGFWRPGTLDVAARQAARMKRRQVNEFRAATRRSNGGLRTHNQDPMTHGTRHIPVLLVQFSDLSFKISDPAGSFDKLLNQQGYSANGATGSVRDFYYDNSVGEFEPVFDVFGPVTLSKTMSYYGKNDDSGEDLGNAAYAVAEAAKLLDNEIDFSNYDTDGDGVVDMILMYYAGYNEAEYGPEESIWPHQWNVDAKTVATLDGKRLSAYFCTSELRGKSGTNMCGIGTTCHEFGHSLGLPDFYDTDYEDNGECGAVYNFSTMCSGSYNNNGCTPPYFNSEERIFLGWLLDSDVQELPDGNVSLSSVKNADAYRSYTDTEGEYFLYECRDGSGWDAPLPKGLVVFHVDKSKSRNVGFSTPYSLWYNWEESNSINAYGDHPCYYVVPAADQTSLYYTKGSKYIVFPGASSIKSYSPVDWDNLPTGTNLSGIAFNSGKVSFTVTTDVSRSLSGFVKDKNGTAIAGASITVSKPQQSSMGLRVRAIPKAPESLNTTTDKDGYFSIDLSAFEGETAHISVSMLGYAAASQDVTLTSRGARVNIVLYEEADGSDTWITYNSGDDYYGFGGSAVKAAICIPAAELARYAGRQIIEVNTALGCSSVTAAYVYAEVGGVCVLKHKIANPDFQQFFTIDISQYGLTVPSGKDLYIGLALTGSNSDTPVLVTPGSGNCYYGDYGLTGGTSWTRISGYDMVFSVHIGADESSPEEDQYQKLADAGYNVIYPGESFTHTAGESFELRLYEASGNNKPSSVEWLYDGNAVSGTSVNLTKGSHKVTAKLVLADGRKEVLELDLSVQ